MSKKWHLVEFRLHKDRTRELLNWLRDQGHELHTTMKFTGSQHRSGDEFTTQRAAFRDADSAVIFKLAWGGK